MVSHNFCRLSTFLFILYSFCSSVCKISINLSSGSPIRSSACSSLLLKLSIQFFISVIVFSSSRFSVWFFFYVFYLFLSFSFCSCIVFLIALNFSSVFSCSSLSIHRRIILNSLSGNSWISISLRSDTGILLYSFGGDMFPLILHDPCSVV